MAVYYNKITLKTGLELSLCFDEYARSYENGTTSIYYWYARLENNTNEDIISPVIQPWRLEIVRNTTTDIYSHIYDKTVFEYSGETDISISANSTAIIASGIFESALFPQGATKNAHTYFNCTYTQLFEGIIGLEEKYTVTTQYDYYGNTYSWKTYGKVNTGSNFTDEDSPSINFTIINYHNASDSPSTIYACIYIDGVELCKRYLTDLPSTGHITQTYTNAYTFNFTEDERKELRQAIQGTTHKEAYYVICFNDGSARGALKRTLTIVGAEPTLNPRVVDIKEETIAVTGDHNTLIRYESMAEFAVNATASKEAEIVSQSVECGTKIIKDLGNGIIQSPESGNFIFKATDSRNLSVEKTVAKNFIPYVIPTCHQDLKTELISATGTDIIITITGKYYNGSFGVIDNAWKLEIRHTNNNGDMSDWFEVTETPAFNGDTYSVEVRLNGFEYSNAYTFQSRLSDTFHLVQSSQYELQLYPVFDWGQEDFNINVPLNMNGETVLRHNKEANNTVLSASGGHIYLRPGGTDNTSGETVINPDGSIKVGGAATFDEEVNFNGNVKINGSDLNELLGGADYVIETGTASMGSNGTWYWQKWASGKAECWGNRNYGNMAVNTYWGYWYRSAVFTQSLPSGLFNTTPLIMNMNMVNANYGCMIMRYAETNPSASSTGSFVVMAPLNVTISPTNIGFHIIGTWQ